MLKLNFIRFRCLDVQMPQTIIFTYRLKVNFYMFRHNLYNIYLLHFYSLPIELGHLERTGVIVKRLVGNLLWHCIGDVKFCQKPFRPISRGVWMCLQSICEVFLFLKLLIPVTVHVNWVPQHICKEVAREHVILWSECYFCILHLHPE